MVLKALDHIRDTTRGLGRFDMWLTELDISLGGRGRMGSMVGASDDFKRLGSHGNAADSQLTEYAVSKGVSDSKNNSVLTFFSLFFLALQYDPC